MKKSYIIILLVILIGISLSSVITGFFTAGGKEKVALEADRFDHIEIDTNNADINLQVTDGEAFVELVNKEKYRLNVDIEGNTLDIEVEKPWFGLFAFDFSFKTPTLNVYLPKDMYDSIQAKTNNGKLDVNDVETKELKMKTNNGKIIVNDVKSSLINLKSNNGEIILENSTGKIIGETSNGNVRITKNELYEPISLETHNGNVTILTDHEPTNATYQLKTHNGNIEVFGSEHFDTVVGNGENLIQLETHNGNINIKK
ncbi:Putative adhesin OS=Ureibacillus acetophenoni OX=614649 GN=SAMN05877842_108135 PE=4 SV=1 [Ureibacillus acetophenoni]